MHEHQGGHWAITICVSTLSETGVNAVVSTPPETGVNAFQHLQKQVLTHTVPKLSQTKAKLHLIEQGLKHLNPYVRKGT